MEDTERKDMQFMTYYNERNAAVNMACRALKKM
jgi:hypothetical protein